MGTVPEFGFADCGALDDGGIPDEHLAFDIPANGNRTVYLAFCLLDGTTMGWAQLTIEGYDVRLADSMVAAGTFGTVPGMTSTFDLPGEDLLMTGGKRTADRRQAHG